MDNFGMDKLSRKKTTQVFGTLLKKDLLNLTGFDACSQ